MHDYIYSIEPERFSFIRVPKILLQNEAYSGISAEAKLLYSLLFDRTELSNKNGWLDIPYPDVRVINSKWFSASFC